MANIESEGKSLSGNEVEAHLPGLNNAYNLASAVISETFSISRIEAYTNIPPLIVYTKSEEYNNIVASCAPYLRGKPALVYDANNNRLVLK